MKPKFAQADLVRLKSDKSKIFYVVDSEGELSPLYTIKDIDTTSGVVNNIKEVELEACNDKVEFTITVKGELPHGFIDQELRKKYADIKTKYGSIIMQGNKADFDKFYNERVEPMIAKTGIKTIGIDFKSIKTPTA